MRTVSTWRLVLGLLIWGAVAAVAGPALFAPEGSAREPAARVFRFLTESSVDLDVDFPRDCRLRRGDPVFVRHDEEFLRSVGRVTDVREEGRDLLVRIEIHPEHSETLREGARLSAFTVPRTAAWIARTLLPPERVRALREMVSDFIAREGRTIRALVWPHVREGLIETVALLESELPDAIAARSERWEALLAKHRDGVVQEELLPALREVTFVLAERKFRPLLEVIGRELWEALPVWGLGWRAVWEKVPFTKEDQVREKFEEYLKDKAKPILASHAGEAARIAGDVVRESLADARVRKALGSVLRTIATDPELGTLVKELFLDLVVRNERFHAIWERRWEAGLSAAASDVADRVEPLLDRIVDSVVLSGDRSALNPRFTRVLRTQILRKDCRWVLLEAGTGAPLPEGVRLRGGIGGE